MSLPAILCSQRFRMRPLQASDAPLYERIYSDATLMEYVALALSSAQIAAAFKRVCQLNQRTELHYWCWVIEDQAGGNDLGLLALVGSRQSAEIGSMILREWHGRGIATEIITCLADHAFREWQVEELFTRHRSENQQARGLMRKLDFEEVAPLPIEDGRTRWVQTRRMWMQLLTSADLS